MSIDRLKEIQLELIDENKNDKQDEDEKNKQSNKESYEEPNKKLHKNETNLDIYLIQKNGTFDSFSCIDFYIKKLDTTIISQIQSASKSQDFFQIENQLLDVHRQYVKSIKFIQEKLKQDAIKNKDNTNNNDKTNTLSTTEQDQQQYVFYKLQQKQQAFQTSFKKAENLFQKRQKHLILQLYPNLSEMEIKTLLEKGHKNTSDLQQKYLFSSSSLNQSSNPLFNKTTIDSIESRHLMIRELERNIFEIHELFRDLITLIDIQHESLNNIEEHIHRAKNHAFDAEEDLIVAQHYQKKARKRRFCLLLCCLGLFGILALILGIFSKSIFTSS